MVLKMVTMMISGSLHSIIAWFMLHNAEVSCVTDRKPEEPTSLVVANELLMVVSDQQRSSTGAKRLHQEF